jgi:hypothetical protein
MLTKAGGAVGAKRHCTRVDPASLAMQLGSTGLAALPDDAEAVVEDVFDARLAPRRDQLESPDGRVGAVRAGATVLAALPVHGVCDMSGQFKPLVATSGLELSVMTSAVDVSSPSAGTDGGATGADWR